MMHEELRSWAGQGIGPEVWSLSFPACASRVLQSAEDLALVP